MFNGDLLSVIVLMCYYGGLQKTIPKLIRTTCETTCTFYDVHTTHSTVCVLWLLA